MFLAAEGRGNIEGWGSGISGILRGNSSWNEIVWHSWFRVHLKTLFFKSQYEYQLQKSGIFKGSMKCPRRFIFLRSSLLRVAWIVCYIPLGCDVNLVSRSLVDEAEGEIWPNPICTMWSPVRNVTGEARAHAQNKFPKWRNRKTQKTDSGA